MQKVLKTIFFVSTVWYRTVKIQTLAADRALCAIIGGCSRTVPESELQRVILHPSSLLLINYDPSDLPWQVMLVKPW